MKLQRTLAALVILQTCCEGLRSLLNVIPRSLMVDDGDNEVLRRW